MQYIRKNVLTYLVPLITMARDHVVRNVPEVDPLNFDIFVVAVCTVLAAVVWYVAIRRTGLQLLIVVAYGVSMMVTSELLFAAIRLALTANPTALDVVQDRMERAAANAASAAARMAFGT